MLVITPVSMNEIQASMLHRITKEECRLCSKGSCFSLTLYVDLEKKATMSWAYQTCVIITILHLPVNFLLTFYPISPTPPLSFCNPYLSVPSSIRNHANLPYILPNGVILLDEGCIPKICSNQDFFFWMIIHIWLFLFSISLEAFPTLSVAIPLYPEQFS